MKKFRKSFTFIFTYVPIDFRRLFRDKVAIFFTFIFPLIFLLIFGGLFGKNNSVNFKVAVINNSQSQFAGSFVETLKGDKVFTVDTEATTLEKAKEKMNQSQLDATIILPEGFGEPTEEGYPSGEAQVLYDQNNQQGGQTLGSVLQSMFGEINAQYVTQQTPFTVKTESTDTKGLTSFDYTFAGLLGFTVLSLGIFGPTNVFPKLKQRGVLRRYQTTPLKVWQYFTANVLSNAAVGLLSVGTMFIAATLLFDLRMSGNYITFILFILLGIAVLFGIGLAVGGWAKNENQAAPLANLITFPMIFLSGSFFPRFLMPEWLQAVSYYLPLTPVIDGTRMIVTEGKGILELGPQIGLLAVWGVVIYFIAFRVFRWE